MHTAKSETPTGSNCRCFRLRNLGHIVDPDSFSKSTVSSQVLDYFEYEIRSGSVEPHFRCSTLGVYSPRNLFTTDTVSIMKKNREFS